MGRNTLGWRIWASWAATLAGAICVLATGASASAAPPALQWQSCDSGQPAGQVCNNPRGVVASAEDGHVFVADQGNHRVVEFDPLGTFLKAWGWDVVASGPGDEPPRNNIQELSVDATGGDFRLQTGFFFTPMLTSAISFDASAAALQAALEADGNASSADGLIDPGQVAVSGPDGGPWLIEFTGELGNTDLAELVVVESTLSGGAATAMVSTLQHGGSFEVCRPEAGDTCKAGQRGYQFSHQNQSQPRVPPPGQLNGASGVALDSAGAVYVVNNSNRRVEKFLPDGSAELLFGGGVNKTKVEAEGATEGEENLCPVDPGDECTQGKTGTGNGQFGEWASGDFIAVDRQGTSTDTDDRVYVGDVDRIQRFNSAGEYQDEFAVPGTVRSLDVDSAGDLYVGFGGNRMHKFSSVGAELTPAPPAFELPKPDEFTNRSVTAIAIGHEDHVFVFANPPTGNGFVPLDRIFEFDQAGNIVDAFSSGSSEFNASTGLAANLCPGSEAPGNLYVTNLSSSTGFLRAYGTFPIGCFKALTEAATNVTETSATLNGSVEPGGEATSECRYEWGTTTAYGNEAPCAETPVGTERVPVHADIAGLQGGTVYHFRLRVRIGSDIETGPDVQLKTLGPPTIADEHLVAATHEEALVKALVNPEGFPTACRVEYGPTAAYGHTTAEVSVGDDRSEHTTGIVVAGLEPGTLYHWRFVCENTAVLNSGLSEGEDRTLATYRPFATESGCPNDALRGGASVLLPDCRAYEMVSPVDKNGGDIITQADDAGSYAYVQARPDGDRLAYGSVFPTFGEDPPNSFVVNQYLADRVPGGWSSRGIDAPFPGRRVGIGVGANRNFMGFTPDLCSAWLIDGQTPPLNPDGQEGVPNLLRRQNCGPGRGSFETLTTAPVPEGTALEYVGKDSVQGHSDDATHALFVARAKLSDDASAATDAQGPIAQIYDRFSGASPAVVSVLPSGTASDKSSAVGSGWSFNLENAVSADGAAVYWTAGIDNSGRGMLYLRQHPQQGIVGGECSGPAKACTTQVSTGASAFFWTAAPDGSAALYSEGDPEASAADLFRFDAAAKSSQLVAEDIIGVAGASEDLSRIYFVSRKAIPGAGSNGFGEEAGEGEPNLYLAEAAGFEFIATLVEGDVGALEPGASVVAYSLVNAVANKFRRATRATPDGAHLAFQSRAPIGGFDNAAAAGRPAVEVYLYEAGGELLCVSCNPSGARPAVRKLGEPYKPRGRRATEVFAAAWIPTWEHPLHASNVLAESGRRLFFNANDALVPHDTNGTQDVYEWEALGAGGCDEKDPSYFSQNGGCVYLISSGQSRFESIFWEASPDGSDVFFTTAASLLPQDPGSIDLYDARIGGGFPQPEAEAECEGEACQSPPAPPEFGSPPSATYTGPDNLAAATPRRCARAARKARRLIRRAGGMRRAARRAKAPRTARRMRRRAERSAKRAKRLARQARRCRRDGRRAR